MSAEPTIDRRLLVAASKDSISAPVADPERSSMAPVPRWISSEKVMTMLEATAMAVEPSAGEKDETVGAILGTVPAVVVTDSEKFWASR